jgi:hypothetical protein
LQKSSGWKTSKTTGFKKENCAYPVSVFENDCRGDAFKKKKGPACRALKLLNDLEDPSVEL